MGFDVECIELKSQKRSDLQALAFLKDSKHYCYICVKKHDADDMAKNNWAAVSKQILKEQEDDQMLYYGGRYSQDSGSPNEDEGAEEYGNPELYDDEFEPQGPADDAYGGKYFGHRAYYGNEEQPEQADQRFQRMWNDQSDRSLDEENSEVSSKEQDRYVFFEQKLKSQKPNTKKVVPCEDEDDIIIAEVEKKSWKWKDVFDEFYEEDYDADVENDGSKPPTEEESKYNSEDEVEQVLRDEGASSSVLASSQKNGASKTQNKPSALQEKEAAESESY